jgi:histidine triad (HIT) family protein
VPSVYTRIIAGELPGRFVWKDDRCVAFLTIAPLRPGHTLVVPREEVNHWLDLPDDLLFHLQRVSKAIGQAIFDAFQPARVGVVIAGLEVPHVHIHLVPIDRLQDLDFTGVDSHPDPAALDDAAGKIRTALRNREHAEASD